jgi:opacity protein-like surface antigen
LNVIGGTFRLAFQGSCQGSCQGHCHDLCAGTGSGTWDRQHSARRRYRSTLLRRAAPAGPYVGATLGYEWGSIDNNPTRPNGVAGGIEAGFNWQTGNFVYGGETDFNLSAADDTFAPWKFSNPWFGTVRARAGFAMDNVLIFGSAGLAYGELTGSTSFGPSESNNSLGRTAGLGAEVTFAQHWSAEPSGSISISISTIATSR